jgi:leucyl aminopeptidase (aminopeptidase T)
MRSSSGNKGGNMASQYDYELNLVAKKMMEDMFMVQSGETVVLTADTGSDMEIVEAFARAAFTAGGKPMVIRVAQPGGEGQEAMPDLPHESLTGALLHADVWIEFNSQFLLYSDIWETAMEKNQKLRYLIIYDATIQQLSQLVNKVDIPLMGQLLNGIKKLLDQAKTISVKSKRGTDFTFELNHDHVIDLDDGQYDKPKFGTLPGYINIVPKFDTMAGSIVFDELMEVGMVKDTHLEFKMEKGKIVDFVGSGKAADMKAFVESFDDENMFKISHMMISLNPGVRALTGSIVIDERIYGGIDLGFGHTSPIDAPPHGQPAKSHFDGIVENTSIWIDDIQITESGHVIHESLKPIADRLLEYSEK